MNVVQTVLVFVGIPAGIVALLALAVYGRAELHQPTRYRPGKPWPFEPVWYLPHPEHVAAASGAHAALDAAHRPAVEGATPGEQPAPTPAAVGGASGEW